MGASILWEKSNRGEVSERENDYLTQPGRTSDRLQAGEKGTVKKGRGC